MNTGKTLFAQIMDLLPCMAVSFDNAFRQRQHYRQGVLGPPPYCHPTD
jgi:hypothetical protein